jgi:serine/threonine protein phosphatase PrpC
MMERDVEKTVQKEQIISNSDLKAYAVTVRGASHVREEKNCQDEVGVWAGEINSNKIFVMAVADGHGDNKYDLSEFGAKLAVEVSIEVIKSLYEKNYLQKDLLSIIKNDFPALVLKGWKDAIRVDLKKRDPLFYAEKIHDEELFFKRYGTTLIVALSTTDGIYLCQLGDGNIVMIDDEGNILEINTDSKLVGNETYSLVSSHAQNLWYITKCPVSKPAMILICTDGLSNCFEEEEFQKFCISLHKNIKKYSFESVYRMLPGWLSNATINGSGDDIGLAFSVDF